MLRRVDVAMCLCCCVSLLDVSRQLDALMGCVRARNAVLVLEVLQCVKFAVY